MTTNRQAGLAFRRAVLIYLLQRGLRVADPTDEATTLYDLIANPRPFTDIAGLEPWIVSVTSSSTGEMSTQLNEATTNARMSGSEWPVVIMGRRGRDVEDSYAIVPLGVMAKIFAGEAPVLTRKRGGGTAGMRQGPE